MGSSAFITRRRRRRRSSLGLPLIKALLVATFVIGEKASYNYKERAFQPPAITDKEGATPSKSGKMLSSSFPNLYVKFFKIFVA